MRCFWVRSDPADSTTAGAGAVYSFKKYKFINRVSTEAGEIPKDEHTMKITQFVLDAV
jgi:hypothetical protein